MTDPSLLERLSALRHEISAAGFDGFLIPMMDEYQSEYVPPCAQRVGFVSGFTGSAAYIIVLKDRAAFFTDSRYTLQASEQVSKDLFALFDTAKKTPAAWLEENIGKNAKIAYDPWLHSSEEIERLKKSAAKAAAHIEPASKNFVDIIWKDRPEAPLGQVVVYDLIYAGKSSSDKRQEIAALLQKKNVSAAVITDAASVAWLLNIRGQDILHTPLPLSRAIIHDNAKVEWFVDPRKVTENLSAHLGGDVSILSPGNFASSLDRLANSGKPILIDAAEAPIWVNNHIENAKGKVDFGDNPCELPKAIKNNVELEGMRKSHQRDGAALTSFLAWLDGNWEKNSLTEVAAAQKLATFREAQAMYRGPSFDTISGAGEHGAIVHYRATPASNAPLKSGQLYLLDSGGQYLDGTTDVTRTIALGVPTAEMRDRFTRVLKGHIALATIRFPEGTTGAELDVLARQYLWEVGLDYGHGTGHGVGCYLGVHEGPQAISKRNKIALQPGMILSNEPGFYYSGHYGIRIENLQAVIEAPKIGASDLKMYTFDTLTLAPIDRRLIEIALLGAAELKWIDAYHKKVREVLSPMVDAATSAWLARATFPIEKS